MKNELVHLEDGNSFIRAHGKEQKDIRVKQYLEVAAELLDTIGYDEISLAKIAKKLNFNRSNIYNYFKCKEELFLALLVKESGELVKDALAAFENMAVGVEAFAEILTEVILKHSRIIELYILANSVILKYVTSEVHQNYRRDINVNTNEFVKFLHANIFPDIEEADLTWLLSAWICYSQGIYPASIQYKEKHGIEIYGDIGYGVTDFRAEYQRYIVTLLKGVMSK